VTYHALLASAEQAGVVSSTMRLAEQGGVIGIMLVLTVGAIVVLHKYVLGPTLESVAVITGSIREIVVANKDTAEVLRGMIDELRPHLPKGNNDVTRG